MKEGKYHGDTSLSMIFSRPDFDLECAVLISFSFSSFRRRKENIMDRHPFPGVIPEIGAR